MRENPPGTATTAAEASPARRGSSSRRLSFRRWVLLGILAALAVGLFAGGAEVRQQLGFELSLDGLAAARQWVLDLGWRGPAAFVGLVTFRSFLLLPSHLVLTLGGLAFGAAGGTLWGSVGLAAAAVLQFGAARILGDDFVRPRLGPRGLALEDRVRRLGPGMVWAASAHPAGPQTLVNLAAGLASLPVWEFALAIALAAPLRAGAYAVLGTSILSWGVAAFAAAACGLGLVLLLPLAVPSLRRWVLAPPEEAEAERDARR